MPKIKGQTVQTGDRPQTNERTHTDGRYQTYYLPCYAVDKNGSLLCFQRKSSLLQSPEWSHVANPSRCQFCCSEYHLSCDQLYPEPAAALQLLALTQLPRINRPKYRGHDDVIVGPGLRLRDQLESVRWWAGDEGFRWTESAADTVSVQSQLSGDEGAGGGPGTDRRACSFNSSELSDLETTGFRPSGRRSDNEIDTGGADPGGRPATSRRRRSGVAFDREWVVRRRSDGSRYIGRRRDSTGRRRPSAETNDLRADPARRSSPRSTSHQTPGTDRRRHGRPRSDETRGTDDVFHSVTTLDRWTSDDDDCGTVEWICSPHCTDSSYRVVAVV